MRMAIESNMRPTSLIMHTQPYAKWNKWDFLLREAYGIYQGELCRQCNMPEYLCHNESEEIHWRIDQDQCGAVRAKEVWEKGKKENFKLPEGTVLRPVPFTTDGAEFASFRTPYYEGLAQRAEEMAAENNG